MTITSECMFLCRSCDIAFACPYWHKAFAPEYLSNWALAVVAIATGVVAFLTLRGIRSQVDSASKAASAAAVSANAVVSGERAIVIARPESPTPYHLWSNGTVFKWSVKNVGEAPALLLETQAIFELVDDGSLDELLPQPNLPQAIDGKGLQLVKGDSYSFETYLSGPDGHPQRIGPGLPESLRLGHQYLRCYGYVKYTDIFKQEHYARFCHYFKVGPNPTESNFKWLLGAPVAYFEQT